MIDYDVERIERLRTSQTKEVNWLLSKGWKILSITQESTQASVTYHVEAAAYFIMGTSNAIAEKWSLEKYRNEANSDLNW